MTDSNLPITIVYGVIAVCGGIARYLSSYVNGQPFRLTIFIASAFVAGFSGWMFALLGQSLSMPTPLLYAMAGVGGFSGEQTMKLIVEYLTNRLK